MMSKKSPQLRFEGFTDDWEERKLSDIADRFDNLRVPITASDRKPGDTPYYGANGIQDYVEGFTHNGEFILVAEDGANDLKNYPVQYVNGKVWVNNHAHVLQGKKTITDNKFLMNAIKNFNIEPFLVGGGRAKLNADVMMKLNILLPTFVEQEKIGSLFSLLDKTIALHQRKLDLLKEQKKGYLQKMFPKNGAKVPELRFAGFADDWEERKLSDVANHRGGTAIEKYFDKDGEYKVISIGSYGLNSQYVDQNIRAISNEITDGRVVNSGELTMVLNDKTANGTIIGRTLLVEKDNEYVINQRTEIISPKENFDSNFAYTILNGPFREKVKRIVQGGTQIYVNYPAVSNLNLELPKIEEQQKIGSFFKQLDDTLALHQRKLDLLKEQKKGFLQKMFV
ncbi:restriction endonuclease subunit S [Lactococcus raffinolactis]|uniref:restriction endonuclease subunit S n=1 Tax=Pseudolactococcus raffinolactis TaxID=1366 RepID=UPI001108BE24|nr:restriction endonuclease subunit S [Lactococcus raffinolactis]TLQ12751.1 restriction endonuclease subunit S [Lactococcus raffinolactis]